MLINGKGNKNIKKNPNYMAKYKISYIYIYICASLTTSLNPLRSSNICVFLGQSYDHMIE